MYYDQISFLTLPSSKKQNKLVVLLGCISVSVFLLAWFFSDIQLPEVKPFFPSYIALVSFTEWITAFLLWNQYKVTRQNGQFILTLTYLFSSLVVIPHILTFPGVFHETGLFDAGSQTAVYFWCFWHGVYPLGFILYFASHYTNEKRLTKKIRKLVVLAGFTFVPFLIISFFILTTRFHHVLPVIIQNGDYSGLFKTGIGPLIIFLNFGAVFLASVKKNKTVMDVLVLLTTITFCLDVMLTIQATARYTVGWYVARMISLFSAGIVLVAFTQQLNQLNFNLFKSTKKLERQFKQIAKQKKQLEHSEENYRLVVNSIHEVIFQMDAKGNIVYTNQYWKELFQQNAPIPPFSLQDFIHEDDLILFDEVVNQIYSSGAEKQEREMRFKKEDGVYIWLDVNLISLKNNHGEVIGAHGTLRELSEQMKRREMEKYRALGQLTTAICHEVRNPLTAVRGFVQLLNEKQINDSNKQYVPIILDELEKAEQALAEYLRFSRPTMDSDTFLSFTEVMNSSIKIIHSFATANNVQVHEELKSDVWLMADRGKLEKILVNIMMNGIEAMPNGGKLYIKANIKENSFLQVIIQDYGVGMSGEEIKRIGEPTYTLNNKGTGFGMMIAKQYILAMDGDITIESKKDFGTKVEVTIPIVLSGLSEVAVTSH